MDYSYSSSVCKRTRCQKDLYYKNLYNTKHGIKEGDSMKSTEYQPKERKRGSGCGISSESEAKKRKKRRCNSRVSDPGVVFLGETECEPDVVFVGETECEAESSALRTPIESSGGFNDVISISSDSEFEEKSGGRETRENRVENDGDKSQGVSSKTPLKTSHEKKKKDHEINERASDFDSMSSSDSDEDDDSDDDDYYVGKSESSDSMEDDSSFYDDDDDGGGSYTEVFKEKTENKNAGLSISGGKSEEEEEKGNQSASREEDSSFYDDDGGNGESSDAGGGANREVFKEKTENKSAGLSISGSKSEEEEEKGNESASREESFFGGNKKEKKLESEHIDTASFIAGCEEVEKEKDEGNVNGEFCETNGEADDDDAKKNKKFEEEKVSENASLSFSSGIKGKEKEKSTFFSLKKKNFFGGESEKRNGYKDSGGSRAAFRRNQKKVADDDAHKEECRARKGSEKEGLPFCERKTEEERGIQSSSHKGEADDAKKNKFEEDKVSENASVSFSGSKSKEKKKITFFSLKKKNMFGGKSEKRHGYVDSGGSRAAFGRNQKKIENDDANKEECRARKESENEGLPFCERKTEEESGTQSSSHIPRVELRDGESSTKVFEEKEVEEEKEKEKEEDKTNDKFIGSGFKKEEREEREMSWKGWEFGSKRKRFGALKDYDIVRLLANSIWEKGEVVKDDEVASEEEAPEQGTKPPDVEEQLPLKFTFGIEEPEPEEKSEFEKELDNLWIEMELARKSSEIGSHTVPVVTDEVTDASEIDKNVATLCRQGKHSLILDEEVGIKCIYCSFIEVEIRYVSPHVEKFPFPSKSISNKTSYSEHDVPMFDGLQFQASGSKSEDPCYQKEGTVWDIIPGTREHMFPHQQEGFEFIWKNLEGTIELDKLNNSDSNDIGGCIISHAPGTGKTRLTLVFLQTYLELFPKCRPVIIAPAGLLLTWEDEFKKWNIRIPFHNLNNPELSEKENKAAVEILKGNRHQSHSTSTIRMVKLFSWSKSKSILGISYSLYEKLAGEKFDKETKKRKAVLDRESEELKKILLELPGLLVLDEGHTPRNHRSYIWKVMSKLQTQKRIILSGTPFQNNFIELCNTLCLVRPAFPDMIPATLKKFFQKRKMPKGRGRREEQASVSSPVDTHAPDDDIKKLRTLMAPFVHVHKGSILQKKLPGLRDCVVVLNPPDLQKRILENMDSSQNTFIVEHKLAMVSVHPSLFLCCGLSEKEESIIGPDQKQQLEMLKRNPCAGVKTRFLIEFIQLCEAIKEKVLVFSQFIDPLSLIIEQLNSKFSWSEGKEILYMYGKLELKQRQRLINTFNDPNSQAKVLLASTRACSEGISLVGASRVILLDVVWNPSVERQAISRAYRLGQERIVYTYHLITRGTAECEKYCKQAEKDRMSELVFSSAKKENDERKSSVEVSEDKILYEMVRHPNLKDMFERIIPQPKESDLVESFGSVVLP